MPLAEKLSAGNPGALVYVSGEGDLEPWVASWKGGKYLGRGRIRATPKMEGRDMAKSEWKTDMETLEKLVDEYRRRAKLSTAWGAVGYAQHQDGLIASFWTARAQMLEGGLAAVAAVLEGLVAIERKTEGIGWDLMDLPKEAPK